jgi:hypothetical protein
MIGRNVFDFLYMPLQRKEAVLIIALGRKTSLPDMHFRWVGEPRRIELPLDPARRVG